VGNSQPSKRYNLHGRLGFRFSRLSSMMKARLDKSLAQHGMTRVSWCILSGIALEDVTTPSGLAEHTGMTRQAISRVLVQMRKDGLIEQSFDAQDGRSRRLALTDHGQSILALCRPLVDENHDRFASKLSAKELAALDQILDALLEGEATGFEDL